MRIIYNNIDDIAVNKGEKNSCCVINPTGEFRVEIKEKALFDALFIFTETTTFNARIDLSGKESSCNINALYALNDDKKASFTATVEHGNVSTSSKQTVKGVAAGRSSFSFYGIVDVKEHSVKTDAEQLHMGLLLSDDAKITASPQLMIRNDDVKCSHGSAVGDLDKNQMFYLKSRGIDEDDAKKILIRAFFADILEKIDDAETKKTCYEKLGLTYDD